MDQYNQIDLPSNFLDTGLMMMTLILKHGGRPSHWQV